jgi:hypothetical chaperone protein
VYCAIDFGTSNSGVAVPTPGLASGSVRLLEFEPDHPTMPTAVFYVVEGLAPHLPPDARKGAPRWRLMSRVSRYD